MEGLGGCFSRKILVLLSFGLPSLEERPSLEAVLGKRLPLGDGLAYWMLRLYTRLWER